MGNLLSLAKIKMFKIIYMLRQKGFFHLLSANLLTQILGFGIILFVAKFITPTELGQIKIFQSYLSIFSIIGVGGLSTAILKICSEKYDETYKRQTLSYALRKSIYLVILTFGLIIIFVNTGIISSDININEWFLCYSIILPFAIWNEILMVYLQALKKVINVSKSLIIIKVQAVLLVGIFTYAWGFEGFIISTICAYIVGIIPLVYQTKITKWSDNQQYLPPEHFKEVAIFSFLCNCVSAIGQYADVFILNHFCLDKEEIGYYSFALIFLMGAIQVNGTVQSIITPYFSEHEADEKWIIKKIWHNQLRLVALSVLIGLCMMLFGYFVVKLFYAESYMKSLVYLKILILKYILLSSYSVVGAAMVGMGMMKLSLIVLLITTPIALFLNYFMIIHFGVIGVAWAQVFSVAVNLLFAIFEIMLARKIKYRNSGFIC